jgi:chaperonin GroEL
MRKIVSALETRQVAQETISEIAGIVGQTLGPGGNPVVLEQQGTDPYGNLKTPIITKDGVTVAEHITYRNHAKNTIAQTILQVAKSTVNQAGDGTTTSIVLADAMFRAGAKHVKQGVNGIGLYEELKQLKDEVISWLTKLSTPIDESKLLDVARISANGDEEVAQVVVEAIKAVGEDGHISLEDGFSRDTKLEKIEGAHYKQGWRKFGPLGSHMINNRARNVCDLERPGVLCYAGELREITDVSDVLKKVWMLDDEGRPQSQVFPILFIAYDFSDDVKNHLMALRVQGKMPIAAIKAPFDGSPNTRTQMMEDLAALLGGQVMARGILDLSKLDPDIHLGCCARVVIGPEETVFHEGEGDSKVVLDRVEDLKKQLEETAHEFDKDNLRLRIGKLIGGVAIIRVGGSSELEMKERKDRIEDALCAAKVAIAEGILPGGGMALYRIANAMETDTIARQIMQEALQAPIKRIIENVGENPDVVLTKMSYEAKPGMGYDARKKEYVNLFEAGIVDPLKVTKSALENAVSIVGLLLTTGGAIVADVDSKDGMANPLAELMG